MRLRYSYDMRNSPNEDHDAEIRVILRRVKVECVLPEKKSHLGVCSVNWPITGRYLAQDREEHELRAAAAFVLLWQLGFL